MKRLLIVIAVVVVSGAALLAAPKILQAPSGSSLPAPANERAPYSKTEAKQKLEAFFGKAFACNSGDEERLAKIIITEQAGHDGSGFGYYEFRIRVPERPGRGWVIDGTMDIGGGIHVTRKVQESQTCVRAL